MRVTIGKGTWEALADVFVQEGEPLAGTIEAAALARAEQPYPHPSGMPFTLNLTREERELLIAGLPRVEKVASGHIRIELTKLRKALGA